MLKLIIVGALLLVIVVVVAALKRKLPDRGKGGLYYLRKSLLTPAERSFLGVLELGLPAGVRLFAKVRLEDIFGVVSGLERGERQGARNRISRKHVDFLLVRVNDLSPVAGIELDDSSHDEEDRRQREPSLMRFFKAPSFLSSM